MCCTKYSNKCESANMDFTLYQKMYAIVCAAASDAVDLLAQENALQAKILLEQALLQAEELYLSHGESSTNSSCIHGSM